MFPITSIDNPTEADFGVIHRGMNKYAAQFGMPGTGGYFYAVHDDSNNMIAAVSGFDNFGPAEIGGLWVDERYRKKGYGKQLVQKAEQWGKQKGCRSMTVFTIKSWPAFEFYRRLGFMLEYERSGHAQGTTGCYLIKKIE